jgi:hypothetical protein
VAKGRYRDFLNSQHIGGTALSRCILVALTFFFFCKLVPAEIQANRLINENPYAFYNPSAANGTGTFFQNPVGPKALSLSLENITEESITESDYTKKIKSLDWDFQQPGYSITPHLSFLDDILSALPPSLLQDRASVPLFVLFHSWKTFPC